MFRFIFRGVTAWYVPVLSYGKEHDRLEGDTAQTGNDSLVDLALVGHVKQVPAEGNQKDQGNKHPCGKRAHDKYQN